MISDAAGCWVLFSKKNKQARIVDPLMKMKVEIVEKCKKKS